MDRDAAAVTVDVVEPLPDPESEPYTGDEDDDIWFAPVTGSDPDTLDPGCVHFWENLTLTDEYDSLLCTKCGKVWTVYDDQARDALLTVWESTRMALARVTRRQDNMAALVGALIDSASCRWCETWTDVDDLISLGDVRACPEHVGAVLDMTRPAEADEVTDARQWAESLFDTGTGDMYALWLVDKLLVDCPGIQSGELNSRRISRAPVITSARWNSALGLETVTRVHEIVRSVAGFLNVAVPGSHAGRNLLLGILARAERTWSAATPTSAEEIEYALQVIVPVNGRDRATAVLDLLRHEMPDDASINGNMVDDMLDAFLQSTAEDILRLFGDAHETPV